MNNSSNVALTENSVHFYTPLLKHCFKLILKSNIALSHIHIYKYFWYYLQMDKSTINKLESETIFKMADMRLHTFSCI